MFLQEPISNGLLVPWMYISSSFLLDIDRSRSPIVPLDGRALCLKGDHPGFKLSKFSLGPGKCKHFPPGEGGRACTAIRPDARPLATYENNTAGGTAECCGDPNEKIEDCEQ